MIRIALRGMAQRPLRTILTAIAIVLGVAMVSAAFTTTDTLRSASNSLSKDSYKDTDAVVSAPAAYSSTWEVGGSKPIPASTLERVQQVPGVDAAVPNVLETAKIVGKDGETVGDAPYFGVGYAAGARGVEEVQPFRLKDGRWAAGPDEVVIDASTAKKEDLAIGDSVKIATEEPVRPFEIVGISRFGTVETLGTATLAIFDLRTAQSLLNHEGTYSDVLVTAEAGVSAPELRSRLKQELGTQFSVRSAADQDRFTFEGLDEFISILKVILLAFGGIAILVGAFNIFNALSITIAQRTRELALARSLGASRAQVLRSVVAEAFATGLLASIIGLGVGYLLAKGVMALLVSVGADLPRAETIFEARTVIVSLVLGTVVTVVAGLAPALRATRVAPVEAMRAADPSAPVKRSRKALVVAAIVTALGVALMGVGLFGEGLSATEVLGTLLPGCLLLFFGIALLSPRFVGPLARVVAWPSRRFGGIAGSLASRNTIRNPGRTAATTAALMIGVALVTFVGVIGNGFKQSAIDRVDESVIAGHVITGSDGWSPFAHGASATVAKGDSVKAVSSLRQREVRSFGNKTTTIDGLDTSTIGAAYKFDWTDGSQATLDSLAGEGAIVRKDYADDHGLKVGSRFAITAPTGDKVSLVVRGIHESPAIDPLAMGQVAISNDTFERALPPTQDRLALVTTDGATTASLERMLAGFPGAKIETRSAYADQLAADLDPLIAMLYVLLALAVLVSVFGIINTLVLSVVERTRELGLLRAVGMSRRQVRRTMRHESVVTALIGATLGIAIGLFLSALVTAALAEEGLAFSLPIGSLIAYVVVAVICGVVAAALPARRAARLDVLGALAHE